MMAGLYGVVHGWARRRLTDPRLYGLLRRAFVTWSWASARPEEDDFRALPRVAAGEGVFVDVGANGGQSAVAAARLLPRHAIVCFEPNPRLAGELDFIRRLVGRDRARIMPFGLAAEEGRAVLHVPHLGALPVEARASLSPEEAQRHLDQLEGAYGRRGDVRPVEVALRPLDSFDLVPDVLKIDVEGAEIGVLQGGMRTIARHRPVILLEKNADSETCRMLLAPLGYVFREWDGRALVEGPVATTRNWFALPEERLESSR